MNAMAGAFVAIDGIDGAGKSTQVRLLRERLERAGREVLTVREPGGTRLGEEIRPILLGKAIPLATETELLLFLASRVQLYTEVIAPAVGAGRIVVSDRYHLSTLVYQGLAGELGEARAAKLVATVLLARRPDLNVVIRLPFEACLERLGDDPDRFESARERMRKVWEGFEETTGLSGDRIVRVDGTGSETEVSARVYEAVKHVV